MEVKGKPHPFLKITLAKLRFPSPNPLESVSVSLCTGGGDVKRTSKDA